jgi:sugar phosphate isomerase/epimerase
MTSPRSSIAVALVALRPEAIAGRSLEPSAGAARFRDALDLCARAKASGVQLDARWPGVRPRELDRSGRRDVALLLRQRQLGFAGVDCLVPPEHFAASEHVDRALASVLSAIELCADLRAAGATAETGSGACVCINTLPGTPGDVLRAIGARAEAMGVLVGDLRSPPAAPGVEPRVGVAIDPVTLLADSGSGPRPDIGGFVLGNAGRIAQARLSDLHRDLAGVRIAPGSATGRLSLAHYRAALSIAGYAGGVVLDLQGVQDPERAIAAAVRAWSSADFDDALG